MEWPVPKNVKELRVFLGLTGYYRRFVKNYGIITCPLTELVKKNIFTWHATKEHVFKNLKKIFTLVPVPRLLDFTQQFTVHCDTSSDDVETILLQHYHQVAYLGKGFSFFSCIKSTYACELPALVLALQKWKNYLLGRRFAVTTDHCSLKYLFHQRVTTVEQQLLLFKLLPFDFTIVYKSGSENKGVDALSHRPQQADFFSLVMPIPLDLTD